MKALCFISLLLPINLFANEAYEVVISDHKFIPDKLIVRGGEKIKLVVINKDDTAEEFESLDLRREKIIPANGKIEINIGPLDPGEYLFFGEFNHKTAQGKIVVE